MKKKPIGQVKWPTDLGELEALLTAKRADPEHQGWQRLAMILNEAVVDPQIRRTKHAAPVTMFLRDLVFEIQTASSVDFQALLESTLAAWRAQQKGSGPREWVQSEWKKHSKAYEQNKSAFARDYVKRVRNEMKRRIDVRTITDRWLKGL